MPTLENYAHADIPHPATIQPAGYRYGCKDTQRGGSHSYIVQDGWTSDGRRNMVQIVTDWLPRKCGTTYEPVMGPCEGCINRGDHFVCQKSPPIACRYWVLCCLLSNTLGCRSEPKTRANARPFRQYWTAFRCAALGRTRQDMTEHYVRKRKGAKVTAVK